MIKKDLQACIQSLLKKVKQLSTNAENQSKIHFCLGEIIHALKESNDYGITVFEKLTKFYYEFKKITIFELKSHNLTPLLMEFLFEGLINTKNLEICDEKVNVILKF